MGDRIDVPVVEVRDPRRDGVKGLYDESTKVLAQNGIDNSLIVYFAPPSVFLTFSGVISDSAGSVVTRALNTSRI